MVSVHRASWRSCGARGPAGGAAARVGAGGAWLPYMRGRRNTQSLYWRSCGARGRRWPAAALYAWQAQYTEPPGGAAARVGAAGPRLPYMRGRRSTQSLLAELRRAWAPLARGCLICVAGAVHRASWRSCGARGRRWPAAAFCVAGAVHITTQLITTYHIPTHHSSTSHTTSHTSLITSEPITAPLLTPDITSPLLTPHFSHLPEVHIKLRYMKA